MKALMWCCLAAVAGCGSSRAVYTYRVVNNDCNCEQFQLTDEVAHVSYSFSGVYSVRGVISTRLTLSIRNDNSDTLDLSLSYIRVSSRNIPYRYNGRFLPVAIPGVPPATQRTLSLDGEVDEVNGSDPWLALAGEELVLTIQGMRMKGKVLTTQVVRFVPQNPNFQ